MAHLWEKTVPHYKHRQASPFPFWQNSAIRYIKWFFWPLHVSEFRDCSCNKKDRYTYKFLRAYLICCCTVSLKRDLDGLQCSHLQRWDSGLDQCFNQNVWGFYCIPMEEKCFWAPCVQHLQPNSRWNIWFICSRPLITFQKMLDCFFDEITAKVVENKLWYRLFIYFLLLMKSRLEIFSSSPGDVSCKCLNYVKRDVADKIYRVLTGTRWQFIQQMDNLGNFCAP